MTTAVTNTGHAKRWLILALVLTAECMDLLDGTVVNVAAPNIHNTLGTSATGLQWIISGYPLALAVGLLVGGRLGDIAGRRKMFLTGITGFTLASAVCGVAPDSSVLIIARLLQGFAGALLIPQGFGLIRTSFPAEELPKVFGFFGPVMGTAAMIGPILGGGLVSAHILGDAWRPVFLVNVPIGLIGGIAAARLLPKTQDCHAKTLDLQGALIATLASAAVIYPLIQGRQLGWPVWTYISIAAGALLFVGFAAWITRRKDPLIEPAIFSHRGYSAGTLILMLYFGAMVGSQLALTLFLQIGQRFSAIHAGLTILPFPLGTAVTAPLAAGLMQRYGGRVLLQIGSLVTIAGYVALALIARASHGQISTWGFAGPLLTEGLGMGFFVVCAFNTILAAVRDTELGSASGTLNAIQQFGAALGVAVLGTVFFSAQGFHPALSQAVWWAAGALVIGLAVSPLLPRDARPEEDLLV
ncbi:MAG: MFS transporter [Solirubrobacterales bacterium]|nr:MFS transporter [Solirubrobacterales bacterium]